MSFESRDYHFQEGASYQAEGRWEDAAREFEIVVRAAPGNVAAHVKLCAALIMSGELDHGVAFYSEMVQLHPDEPVLHYQLGRLLERSHNEVAAEQAYERVAAASERRIGAHPLGRMLARQGRRREARHWYKEAIRGYPQNELAKLELDVMDREDLLLESHPDPAARFELGRRYVALERWSQSVDQLSMVVLESSEHREAWVDLGRSHEALGNLAEAIVCYKTALQIRSEPGGLVEYHLAQALWNNGQRTEAIREAWDSFHRDPENFLGIVTLLGYDARHGRRAEALVELTRLRSELEALKMERKVLVVNDTLRGLAEDSHKRRAQGDSPDGARSAKRDGKRGDD